MALLLILVTTARMLDETFFCVHNPLTFGSNWLYALIVNWIYNSRVLSLSLSIKDRFGNFLTDYLNIALINSSDIS